MEATLIPHFGLFQRLLIFRNRHLIIRFHLGQQRRPLVGRCCLELLPNRLSILHGTIAACEMRLHQIGSLQGFLLRLLRRFDVCLLHLRKERRQQDDLQRQRADFQ